MPKSTYYVQECPTCGGPESGDHGHEPCHGTGRIAMTLEEIAEAGLEQERNRCADVAEYMGLHEEGVDAVRAPGASRMPLREES